MRVFILSIIIMALIISAIVCNTLYMDSITNRMLDIIKEMPEYADSHGDDTKINELIQLWHSNVQLISIITISVYIIDINEAIIDVETYYYANLDAQYKSAREHLYQAVLRLHELERISLDNII